MSGSAPFQTVSHPKGLLAGFHYEQDSRFPELIHCGEQWMPQDFQVGPEAHQGWEFYYMVHGTCDWEALGKTHSVSTGQMLVIPTGISHRMRPGIHAKHHALYAGINMETIWRRHPSLRLSWEGKKVVLFQKAEEAYPAFRQLIHEVSVERSLRETALQLCIDLLAIEVTRLLDARISDKPLLQYHTAVLKARGLLDKQPGKSWKIQELADLCHLSPSRLTACFRRQIGVSPHQYQILSRIEKAKQLLRTSNQSITEIGLELGFSSIQHFANTFRRLTKRTPHAYRSERRAALNELV